MERVGKSHGIQHKQSTEAASRALLTFCALMDMLSNVKAIQSDEVVTWPGSTG